MSECRGHLSSCPGQVKTTEAPCLHFFGRTWDEMGQKRQYLAQNEQNCIFWTKFGLFGPKILIFLKAFLTSLFSDSINSQGWDICQADICHPRIRSFANLKTRTFARPTIATRNYFSFTGALLFWLRFSGVSSFH